MFDYSIKYKLTPGIICIKHKFFKYNKSDMNYTTHIRAPFLL